MDILAQRFPFQLPPLPYAYDALEPYIHAETLHYHHDKHLKKYVDTLNEVLTDCPELQSWTLGRLLTRSDALPCRIRRKVSRNAGGVYNHELYFAKMSPPENACRQPSGWLGGAIARQFGSWEQFRDAFKAAALDVFGSGYAVLARDNAGCLCIRTLPNQHTVLPQGLLPVNLCDVWEHAYYLDYRNERDRYIDAWFAVADWNW